jgi:hypothetical protein
VLERNFSGEAGVVYESGNREGRWIDNEEGLSNKTGYVESLCIFRTPASNILGAGLWILINVESNRVVEAVMFHEDNDVLERMKLDSVDLGNGKTKVTRTITMTALSEEGNTVIEMVSDETPAFPEGLEYFLTHGRLKPLVA